ncbi:MAG TPA: DUF6441 family protein [Rhizomicrobium sp.]
MKHSVSEPDFSGLRTYLERVTARAVTGGIDEGLKGFVGELRDQVASAGMGQRLANTWRGNRYPLGRDSIDAAAFVVSRVPDIIDAFARGAVIRTVNGKKYLAIPSENVPRVIAGGRGSKKRMTPEQVETYFNQDLKFAPSKKGKGELIAFIDAVGGSAHGFRRATGKQLGRLYRGRGLSKHVQILMFTMVPTVRMQKRLDPDGSFAHWSDRTGDFIAERLSDT